MARFVGLVKQQLGSFSAWRLEHILRVSNERVDTLVAMAASILTKDIVFLLIYYQSTSSVKIDRES